MKTTIRVQISMSIGEDGKPYIETRDGNGIERLVFKPTALTKMLATLLMDSLRDCEQVHRECTVTDQEYKDIVKKEILEGIKDIIKGKRQ